MIPIHSQLILVLALQCFFFLFYYKSGFKISKIIGRRVCPVCFAVGSTWLSLLIIRTLGLAIIEKTLISVLLSESVVGVSYLVEEFLLVYNLRIDEYLLKFGIILYGTFSVMTYSFVNEKLGFLLFLPVITFGFFSLTPNRGLTKGK